MSVVAVADRRSMGRGTRVRRLASAVLVAMTLAGCEVVQSVLDLPDNEPAVLELSHEALRLVPGERFRLYATLRNQAGEKVGGAVSWESTNQNYGVVDTSGTVSALTDTGEFTVVARAGDVSASAQVTLVSDLQCFEPVPGQAVNAELFGFQVLQSVEAWPERVPLITGRPAIVRVSLLTNGAGPARLPAEVTVHATRNGAVVGAVMAEGPECLPATPQLARPDATFNAVLPSTWLASDVDLHVTATVLDGSGEAQELRYPAEGHLRFDVVRPAPLDIVLVPLSLTQHGVTAEVSEDRLDDALLATRAVFPLHEVNASLRAPLTYDIDDDFRQVLDVLYDAWLLDGASVYYHALVPSVIDNPAAGGIAQLGGPLSWSLVTLPAYSHTHRLEFLIMTVAHELGHNFGLYHASCGLDGNHDPTFPHFDGRTNTYGFNWLGVPGVDYLVQPNLADLMSYCRPRWISDHNYAAVMRYRLKPPDWSYMIPASVGTAGESTDATVMLVGGRIDNGSATLRPTFTFQGNSRLPVPGDWRWQLLDARQRVLVEVPFEPLVLSEPADGQNSMFAFTVPVTDAQMSAAHSARILGPDGAVAGQLERDTSVTPTAAAPPITLTRVTSDSLSLTWDASRLQHVMVRDATTGQLLARGSGGRLAFVSSLDAFQLLFSNGLDSTELLVRVGAG